DENLLLPDLLPLADKALAEAESLLARAKGNVARLVASGGIDRHQHAAHGFAWMATYVEALRQLRRWAGGLGELREAEALMLQAAFGEYLAQLRGGIAMSQTEIVRPGDLGLEEARLGDAAERLIAAGNTDAVRMRLARLFRDSLDTGDFGRLGLD